MEVVEVKRQSMKAIIQRVLSASVTVDGRQISAIGPGLLVLIGVGRDDTKADADYIARKLLNLKLWPALPTATTSTDTGSESQVQSVKPWARSVTDCQHSILLVSQFTLHCELKGNRPDFHSAMAPATAKEFYLFFVQSMKALYHSDRVLDGEFGADMTVALVNDGPVTIPLDTEGMNFSVVMKKKAERPFANISSDGNGKQRSKKSPQSSPSAAGVDGVARSTVAGSVSDASDQLSAAVASATPEERPTPAEWITPA